MTRSENGRGDPTPLTAPRKTPGTRSGTEPDTEPDRDQTQRRIAAATDDLARLQQILLEILCNDRPAAPLPPRSLNLPVATLSRTVLDQLAHAMGDPPLRNRPDLPQRGLRLVAGRDMPAGSGSGSGTPPLRLRIDRHLRLCLDGASNQVAVERLTGMRWQGLELCGQKDGHGGVTLALAALERLAGPLSPWLTRLLQPMPDAIPDPDPRLPPCPEEG